MLVSFAPSTQPMPAPFGMPNPAIPALNGPLGNRVGCHPGAAQVRRSSRPAVRMGGGASEAVSSKRGSSKLPRELDVVRLVEGSLSAAAAGDKGQAADAHA